jgi:undecaprenyl-diphosphatase
MTTNTTHRRRPSAVVTVLAVSTGAVAALAIASWTTQLPSTQAVYRVAAASVLNAPSWVRLVADVAAEAGIVVLATLVLVLTWRAMVAGTGALSRALVAGGGAVAAYATSELLKLLLTQPRPCARLGVTVLAECPAANDWSLPSNHATIAAALATAAVLIAPRWGAPALVAALAVAAARVGTGVHYPHDVLTGLVLGAAVVVVTVVTLDRPVDALLRATARRWPASRTAP